MSASPKYILLAAGLVFGAMLARHGFSEGLRAVVSAEREPPPNASMARWEACEVDADLRYANPARCQMEMRNNAVAPPQPIDSMNATRSEEAGGWFMLAAFAIALSLGIAALFGYLILRPAQAAD